MKKVLLGSTALVAAGLMAGPAFAQLEVSITGSVDYHFGYASEDKDTDRREYGMTSDTIINVNADGVADNGLEYGARINLDDEDIDGQSGLEIDETWIYIRGGFGEFRFGEDDNVASNLRFAIPAVGNGQADGDFDRYVNPEASNDFFGTDFVYDSDDTKLIYFIQRSGFTVGASFAPTNTARLDDPSMGEKDGPPELENIVAIGGNYQGQFTNGSWGVSAGAVFAKNEDTSPATNADEDWQEYGAAFEVGFRGFTGGGLYIYSEPNDTVELSRWGLGVTYSTGPWSFGGNYLGANLDTGAGDDDKDTVAGVGVEYALADGLTPYADLVYFDYDRNGAATENDGTVFLVGVTASF